MNQDLRILIVEDDSDFRKQTVKSLLPYNDIYEADTLSKAKDLLKKYGFDVAILDKSLPDGETLQLLPELLDSNPNCATLILTGDNDQAITRKYMAAGALDYVQKTENAILDLKIRIPAALSLIAERRKSQALEALLTQSFRYEIVGYSEDTRKIREKIFALKGNRAPVLITGETGTGKELVARMLNKSESPTRAFVSINCGAIPAELIESELFGHRRGAFTGAISDKMGKFELAHNGDIFLDEIGDLPPSAQVKLLRILQEGEFTRVGDTATRHISTRVIAATNKDLEQEVKNGKFRGDLYYRLNVIPIHLTPLRTRTEDIEPISKFILTVAGKGRFSLTSKAFNILTTQPWPGNVRQLKNALERAKIEAQIRGSTKIESCDIAFLTETGTSTSQTAPFFPKTPSDVSMENLEKYVNQAQRDYLAKALVFFDNSPERLSRHLGLCRSALFRRLASVGITKRRVSNHLRTLE